MGRRIRGTVGKRKDRKGWWCRLTTADGKRVQKFGGDTKREAVKALQELLKDQDDPHRCSSVTLSSYLERGYLKRLKSKVAASTFPNQETQLLAAAGLLTQPMDQVNRGEAKDYLVDLLEGRSPNTVRRYQSALSTCWEDALDRGQVLHNPWKGIKLPRAEMLDVPFLSKQDLDNLYQAVPEHYRPMVIFLGETGARMGEARNLTWDRVDLTRKVVKFTQTKTKRSRTIPLSPKALGVLKTLKRASEGSGEVFQGIALYSGAGVKAWKQTVKDQGFPGLRFHDLRHARATLMVRAGVPIPSVAAWLGHSTSRLVLDRYGCHAPHNHLEQALRLTTEAYKKTG